MTARIKFLTDTFIVRRTPPRYCYGIAGHTALWPKPRHTETRPANTHRHTNPTTVGDAGTYKGTH